MFKIVSCLIKRIIKHDLSKFSSKETDTLSELLPELKASTYGTPEYYSLLKRAHIALNHHYANNSHHPEYYKNGIQGMSMFDILEMIADWKAAVRKHADGDFITSLQKNKIRFKIPSEMYLQIIEMCKEAGL